MTNDEPLARKIASLIAKDEFDGPALRLGLSGAPDAMDHILNAVDDTMMLRNAVFSVGKSAVTLKISGKRVLSVVSVTEDLTPPDGLIDQPLSTANTEILSQVETVLQNLVAQEGTLTLERKATTAEKQLGSGVGVQALNASWAEGRAELDAGPMAHFIAKCKPLSEALILLVDDEVELTEGEQLKVDILRGVYDYNWAAFDEAHQTQIGASDSTLMRISDALGPKGQAFVHAIIEEKQYLALVELSEIPQVASAWSAALTAA